MIRFALAAGLAGAMAAPALADCNEEINDVWAVVQDSELEDAEKNQVAAVLLGAQEQQEAGDEAACMDTVVQVRIALGLEG